MTDFLSEYAEYQAEHGTPERIELLLCDLNGILRGKWLPPDQAGKLAKGQVRLPLSTYAPAIMGNEVPETGLGIVAGDPDGYMRPVPGSLAPVPWAEGHVAQVLVEMSETPQGREPSRLSSRAVLERMVGALAQKGMQPVVASELEFYIIRKRDDRNAPPQPPQMLPDAQNYELSVLDRFGPLLDEIRDAAHIQRLNTDTLIAEFGPGQFEINFHHGPALEAAQTALLFRRLVRGVVARHGLEASFMAKPYAEEPGNGMHVHVSLEDESGANIFRQTELLERAVAGLLGTMSEFQALFAPHRNSYRRFAPESFAPARPDWGHDNRAAAIRLPETRGAGARLEHRICGADVNPYLAIAAILHGILHGLETDLPLPKPLGDAEKPSAEPLGQDWAAALARLAASEHAQALMPEGLRDVFVAVKRDEIRQFESEITPAEYRNYLSRF